METRSSQCILVKENWQTIYSAFFHQQHIEHKERTRIDRYTYRGSVTNCFSGVPLNTFMDATEAEIWNIIKLSPVKSCELDPLHTWLLKEMQS